MREVKFRAWDKNNVYGMIKVSSIDWKDSGELNFFSGGKRIYRDGMENYILMQYTGLKDKKRTLEYPGGQEIYEGDIIEEYWKSKNKDSGKIIESSQKAVVRWGHQDGDYEESEFDGWMLGNNGLVDGSRMEYNNSYWKCLEYRFEIIGNIYRNPELVKNESV